MALNSKNIPSSNRPPVLEPGTYKARVVQVVDLGLQPQPAFQGKDKPPAYVISVTYELVEEFMKDEDGEDIEDKPRWITERFNLHNLSQDRAKSTIRYKALDPQNVYDGDWSQLVDTPCYVTLVEWEKQGKRGNNVSGVSSPREKEKKSWPPLINSPVVFDLSAPDLDTFSSFPDWLKDIIKSNLEYKGSVLDKLLGSDNKTEPAKDRKRTPLAEELDDDVPF